MKVLGEVTSTAYNSSRREKGENMIVDNLWSVIGKNRCVKGLVSWYRYSVSNANLLQFGIMIGQTT